VTADQPRKPQRREMRVGEVTATTNPATISFDAGDYDPVEIMEAFERMLGAWPDSRVPLKVGARPGAVCACGTEHGGWVCSHCTPAADPSDGSDALRYSAAAVLKRPAPRKPYIGQAVHYVSRASADGVYDRECRAATVTEVGGHDYESGRTGHQVGLHVTTPTGQFFDRSVHYHEGHKPDADEPSTLCNKLCCHGGTWHFIPEAG
jgi:hypothetical protein